jgi:hypothetical protein
LPHAVEHLEAADEAGDVKEQRGDLTRIGRATRRGETHEHEEQRHRGEHRADLPGRGHRRREASTRGGPGARVANELGERRLSRAKKAELFESAEGLLQVSEHRRIRLGERASRLDDPPRRTLDREPRQEEEQRAAKQHPKGAA